MKYAKGMKFIAALCTQIKLKVPYLHFTVSQINVIFFWIQSLNGMETFSWLKFLISMSIWKRYITKPKNIYTDGK